VRISKVLNWSVLFQLWFMYTVWCIYIIQIVFIVIINQLYVPIDFKSTFTFFFLTFFNKSLYIISIYLEGVILYVICPACFIIYMVFADNRLGFHSCSKGEVKVTVYIPPVMHSTVYFSKISHSLNNTINNIKSKSISTKYIYIYIYTSYIVSSPSFVLIYEIFVQYTYIRSLSTVRRLKLKDRS
jgi:hypothetical protein